MKAIIKENGIIRERKKLPKEAHGVHLCWSCQNGCPNNCSKVRDIRKKSLEKYSFITSGYQIIEDDGKLRKMYVTACDNYVFQENREPDTREEIRRIKEAREKLHLLYYGVDTMEEVYRIERVKREKERETAYVRTRKLGGR